MGYPLVLEVAGGMWLSTSMGLDWIKMLKIIKYITPSIRLPLNFKKMYA